MHRALPLCAVLLLAAPAVTQADVLLGEIPMGLGGGGGGVVASSITKISFEFGYSTDLLSGVCVVHRVGCEPVLASDPHTGSVYTFTSANSQWFNEIAGRLTNGTSEGLAFVNRFYDSSGAVKFANGSGGSPEKQVFGTASDLVGNTITRITLTLDHYVLVDPNSVCGAPGVLCYQADTVWRVYGTPVGTPTSPTSWGAMKSRYR